MEDAPDDFSEEDRIADLGRPRLGDPIKVACHIRESMEFKVRYDVMLRSIFRTP